MKYTAVFAAYRVIEKRLQHVICGRFGLVGPEPPSVKVADRRLVMTERRDLMPPSEPWSMDAVPLAERIQLMSPAKAEPPF